MTKVLKKWYKPSKVRKMNRLRRVLISSKKIEKLRFFTKDKEYQLVRSVSGVVFHPKFLRLTKIYMYMKRIQFVMRRLYNNIRERRLRRMHLWIWKERKNNLYKMPHNYYNTYERTLLVLLMKAKFMVKPYVILDSFKENKKYLKVDDHYPTYWYRSKVLKSFQQITIESEFDFFCLYNTKENISLFRKAIFFYKLKFFYYFIKHFIYYMDVLRYLFFAYKIKGKKKKKKTCDKFLKSFKYKKVYFLFS